MENVSYSLLQRYSATVHFMLFKFSKFTLSIYVYIYKYIDRLIFGFWVTIFSTVAL